MLIRPQGPQPLNDTEAHATAPVNGNTRRLIEDKELRILVDNGFAQGLLQIRRRPPHFLGRPDPYRGNPDLVVRLQTRVGACTMAVYADFAFADNPVNLAARNVSQALVHIVIQTLSRLVLADLKVPTPVRRE